MAKEEWGTKRTCPKCGERFYDLGKSEPCVCIECGTDWIPEPILKTKQPIVVTEEDKEKSETEEDDLEVDVEDDDEDDVLGDVSLDDDDDDEVSSMIDTKIVSGGDD